MASNKNMNKAKDAKNDEWYTQIEDIEKEMAHYKDYFKGKVVFCNCDDPYESNFFKFFALNFNHLGIKKLIATSYISSPIVYTQLSLFDDMEEKIPDGPVKKPYKIVINEVPESCGAIDLFNIETLVKDKHNELSHLIGDGDFRSEECIEILKEADVIVTNPPFSLFREYIDLIRNYKKDFIVMGKIENITYKEVFDPIMYNEMWLGYGFNLSVVYKTAYPNKLEANRKFVISKGYDPDEGYVKVPGICWFTNIDVKKRHEELIMYKKYSPDEYPKYDNLDGIDVDKIADIPIDYYGIMGVPITFMDKYNPDQFEILGFGKGERAKKVGVTPNYRGRCDVAYTLPNGKHKCPFGRMLIRRRSQDENTNA